MVNVVAKPRGSGGGLGWTKTRRAAWLVLVILTLVYLVRFIKKALDDDDQQDDIHSTYSSSLVENAAMFGQLEGKPANQRIAYIMYSYGHFSTKQFKERVAESLKTWLIDYGVLYYIVNKKWQGDFDAVCQSNKELAAICQQIIPIHINCEEEESSSSPNDSNGVGSPSSCCRHDQGMATMWRDYSSYDWYVYLDDDIYMRTAFMNDFLSGLSPVEPLVLTDEIPQSLVVVEKTNCSNDSDFLYPKGETAMVYSNAALQIMSPGFEMNAILTQCAASFHNNHDGATAVSSSYQTANALVHWMYSLPHVRLPRISGAVEKDFHSTFTMIGLHGAGNQEWSRKNSDAMEIHKHVRYRRHPKPPYNYQWHKPMGFMQTSIYRKYGDIRTWTEWHALPPFECLESTTPENNQTYL